MPLATGREEGKVCVSVCVCVCIADKLGGLYMPPPLASYELGCDSIVACPRCLLPSAHHVKMPQKYEFLFVVKWDKSQAV